MKKQSKYIPSILMLVIMGALFTACSQNQAAIDQAVQQTVEAQQQNQVDADQDHFDAEIVDQANSIESTETEIIEQTSPMPEETTVTSTASETDSQRIFSLQMRKELTIFSVSNQMEKIYKKKLISTQCIFSVYPLTYLM
jgi:hypothetical protein